MIDFIRDMWDDGRVGRTMLAFLVLAVVMVPVGIWASIEESRQWDAFSREHNCKVVGKMRGDVTTTVAPIIGGNGEVAVGISSTPDKTAWACDDGVTYWR